VVETGEPKYRIVGFAVTHVFDVSQTDGEPLPEPVRPQLLAGQAPDGLWDALARQVDAAGFTLARCPDAAAIGGANGVTDYRSRTVTVRADVTDAQAVKTLAHELAHVLLHNPDNDGRPECRGIVEVEAESVAYLVAAHQEMDTSDYTFAYVAGWAEASDDPGQAVRGTADRVLRAAGAILAAVDPDPIAPVETTSADVVEDVRDRAHDALARAATLPGTDSATDIDRLRAVVADASEWFIRQGDDSPELAAAVTDRGIDPGAARHLGIGWAPDSWQGLVDHLGSRGHSRQAMLDAGVAAPRRRDGGLYDAFRSRVMFTITDADGQPVGFTGRLHGGARGPKYLNTASTPLFHKGEVLYGSQAITPATQKVVVVEGPWDATAITYATSGRTVGLAACGTAFTGQHAQLVAALDRPVAVFLDSDAAGHAAGERVFDQLSSAGVVNPEAIGLAAGLDPSEYTAMFGIDATQRLVADPNLSLAQQIIDRRLSAIQPGSDPAAAVNAVKGVADIVRKLPLHEQGRLAAHIAEETGLLPTSVVDALTQGGTHRGRLQAAPAAATDTVGLRV